MSKKDEEMVTKEQFEDEQAERVRLSAVVEEQKQTIAKLEKNQPEERQIDADVPVRQLAAGTRIAIGNTSMELVDPAYVTYPEAESEQHFAGMCILSENFEANAAAFKFRYDKASGARLPINEQIDEPTEEEFPDPVERDAEKNRRQQDFIASLSEEEAESFGVADTRAALLAPQPSEDEEEGKE